MINNNKKNYQFYHIYPLGMLKKWDGGYHNIGYLNEFVPVMKELSINVLYIGPLFNSEHHGYDTIDYYEIDPRLGTNEDAVTFFNLCKAKGIDIVIDCVFNHVSRSFFAFRDVCAYRENSMYKDWFFIDFTRNDNELGFSYASWDGHDELVKLNLSNPYVKDYLFRVVRYWMETFNIDGLRIDAADVMDRQFLKELNQMTKSLKSDFFIVGEMVHGDYNNMILETGIDSVSNYECYKGLYSSLNDLNYHEIGYSFNRLFGEGGRDRNHNLYNFVDNHDVNRVASTLKKDVHLYPLYIMLYTMKGYTSIYYKSEMGAKGARNPYSDEALRPAYDVDEIKNRKDNALYKCLEKLSTIREYHSTLCFGLYEELLIESDFIAYKRSDEHGSYMILINSGSDIRHFNVNQLGIGSKIGNNKQVNVSNGNFTVKGFDLLNDERIESDDIKVYPNRGRIIKL